MSLPMKDGTPVPGSSDPNAPYNQPIPTDGPATQPDGPRAYEYKHPHHGIEIIHPPPPGMDPNNQAAAANALAAAAALVTAVNGEPPKPGTTYYTPSAAELYHHAQALAAYPAHNLEGGSPITGAGANHYPSAGGVPRLPPILQVEKVQVTTSATQLASASRRRNEAHFVCPVPGCGSTFTRRFNLRGHLRSHTEERPYVCEWPGCKKGFARQHDCKRHQALHTAKSQNNVCLGCKKTFSRLDALNRHLRSEGGAECRRVHMGEDQGDKNQQNNGGPSAPSEPHPQPPQMQHAMHV